MKALRKLFGGIDLTWKKVILLAVAAGVYTAIMAILPVAKDTSFADITISFEVWILFGVFLIMNSRSPLDSGLKCFVFFLISQPLVYLLQVPFSWLGWGILGYYRNWILWTLLTFPMGFVGYYLKRDKWWGLLILTPVMLFLGIHYSGFLGQTCFLFPRHLLSTLFCAGTILLYPVCIFKNKKVRTAGVCIGLAILVAMTVLSLARPNVYRTTVLVSGGKAGAVFDGSYTAALSKASHGTVRIEYNSSIESYMLEGEFVRGGKTDLILTAPDGSRTVYGLDVSYSSIDVEKK